MLGSTRLPSQVFSHPIPVLAARPLESAASEKRQLFLSQTEQVNLTPVKNRRGLKDVLGHLHIQPVFEKSDTCQNFAFWRHRLGQSEKRRNLTHVKFAWPALSTGLGVPEDPQGWLFARTYIGWLESLRDAEGSLSDRVFASRRCECGCMLLMVSTKRG